MCKKFFVSLVVCMGLLGFAGAKDAKAWVSVTNWGWAPPSSLHCWSDWKGIGNVDVNPMYAECAVDIQSVLVSCMNNGGGTGGEGTPFLVDISIAAESDIQSLPDGRGQGSAEVSWENDELLNIINPDALCTKNNWTVNPDGEVIVLEGDVTITGYDEDGVTPLVSISGHCSYNSDANIYDCTSDAQIKYK
jgi:hypothetical protein